MTQAIAPRAPARRARLRSLLPALVALLASGAAAQQPAPQRAGAVKEPSLEKAGAVRESVWSRGVPEDSRRAADALFKEGNALLRDSITITAAAKYREALAHWDHPNIHYNLALALMSLDQPIETHAHLVAAMKYGPEPLEKERFEHARNYLSLLEKQLARVKVRCDVTGAKVEMDGAPLFTPPGEYEALVRAGRHTIVASREGLVPNQSVRTLIGGQTSVVDLELRSLEELTQYRRRWSAWIPWTIAGAGAAVALAGGALQYGGLQAIDRVDRESRARCPAGCAAEPADLASDRARGDTMQKIAWGAYGVGGAALATGAVLAYLNRTERYVRPYEAGDRDERTRGASIDLAPVIDGDRRGLVATVRY